MRARLTPVENAGVLRVISNEGKYGEPYTFCCTYSQRGDTYELLGITKAPTLSETKAIMKELKRLGAKYLTFIRLTPKSGVRHTITLGEYDEDRRGQLE